MTDLISRQSAIKAICEDSTWLESQGCTDIWMAERKQRDVDILSGLPSIDAVPQWIPCEERLPEEGVVVVTVDKDGDYEINAIIDEEDCEWFWEKPVAWMPLPKPYEAERKEE